MLDKLIVALAIAANEVTVVPYPIPVEVVPAEVSRATVFLLMVKLLSPER